MWCLYSVGEAWCGYGAWWDVVMVENGSGMCSVWCVKGMVWKVWCGYDESKVW